MEQSEIAQFYAHKTIFITGATGFLGKVLIEKLLRSCPRIKKIYVLVRTKKNTSPQQRINEILNSPMFDSLSQSNPNFKSQLEAIEGDLLLPSMGLREEDEKRLVDSVNIVFHSAATIRFDETIKIAVEMNIVGTRKVIDLCKKMAKLEAFIHVSTAYANCDRKQIDEIIYPPPMDPDHIIKMLEWMSDDKAQEITASLIRPRPNTYTFTKAIGEALVVKECEGKIPCSIVRPSIVGAALKEPLPGWLDNYNGPTVIFAAVGKGILRSLFGRSQCAANLIPVDFPTNMMIVAAWATANERMASRENITVFNSTVNQSKKLTWGSLQSLLIPSLIKNPLEGFLFVPKVSFTMNRLKYRSSVFAEQLFPSYVADMGLKIARNRPKFMRLQEKLGKAIDILEYFLTNEWNFSNENVLGIEKQMSEVDRKVLVRASLKI